MGCADQKRADGNEIFIGTEEVFGVGNKEAFCIDHQEVHIDAPGGDNEEGTRKER